MWEQSKILYNVSLPDCLDGEKKSKAINEISEELPISEDQVTKKMASLRSYYYQLRSSYDAAKTKSGSGTSDIKRPTWIYFDMLKFLDDNLMAKGSSSNDKPSNVPEFKKQKKDEVPLKNMNG